MTERRVKYGSMLNPVEAARRLQESGARMTAQRRAVLDILHDNRTHPTAEEIELQVRKRLGCVASATVYNTLEVLQELGFVRRIDGLEGRAHFDPDTSDHQHAICSGCKRVWDVGPMEVPSQLPDGFNISDIVIQGMCAECDAAARQPSQ